MSMNLWDVEHDYYCSTSNFYERGMNQQYRRWQDFLDAEGDSDLDMNLVFRWDWIAPREDLGAPIKWHEEEAYRDSTLHIFFINQRKGIFRSASIDVCRLDQPSVRAWLQVRYEHMLKLWMPFAPAVPSTAEEGRK